MIPVDGNSVGSSSVGGSALQHKLDLAQLLMQRHDEVQSQKRKEEAVSNGVWKGGNEENFINMVKDVENQKEAKDTRIAVQKN